MQQLCKTALSCAVVAWSAQALATTPDPYAWETPPGPTQAHGDRTPIPRGMGGVFVPALSRAGDEPDVFLVDGARILRVRTGRRVAVPPGEYVLLVGSAEPSLSEGAPVRIQEGRTTVVPVTWGGLRLDVVGPTGRPSSATLEIVDARTGASIAMAPELGADPGTRLLRPGLYRVQLPGSEGTERPDFTTVHVPAEGLVVLRVFINGRGAMVGSAVVPTRRAAPEVGPEGWRRTLVVGMDGSVAQNRSVPGTPDFAVADGSAFLAAHAGWHSGAQELALDGGLNLGVHVLQPSTGVPLPPIKSRDRLEADALYTLLLNDGVGAYASTGGETKMLPTNAVAAQDLTARFISADGSSERIRVPAGSTYPIASELSPTQFRSGTGLRLRLASARSVELSARGGLGLRGWWFGDALIPLDNPDTAEVEYVRPESFFRAGLETGARATVRLTPIATWTTDLVIFDGFDDLGRFEATIATWDNDVSLALTRAVSVHYEARFDQLLEITPAPMVQHGLYLRASWNLL